MTREILFKVHVCANFSKIRVQNGIRTLTLLPFLEPEMVDHLGKNSIHSLFDFIRKSMLGVTLRTRTRGQKYTDSILYNEKQAGIFDVVILRPCLPFIHCFAQISSITPFSPLCYLLLAVAFLLFLSQTGKVRHKHRIASKSIPAGYQLERNDLNGFERTKKICLLHNYTISCSDRLNRNTFSLFWEERFFKQSSKIGTLNAVYIALRFHSLIIIICNAGKLKFVQNTYRYSSQK